MSLNRRQFLILGAACSGFGLSVVAQRLLANGSPPSPPAVPPSPIASPHLPTSSSPHPSTPIAQSPTLFNPPRGDVRLVVISDLNSRYGSTDYEPEVDQAIALLPTWQPDLVLCGGDMVAGQSASLSRAEIQAMWDAFDQHVSAPLRRAKLPFGFTIGNHDGSGYQDNAGQFVFAADRAIATAYWQNPAHDPGLSFVDRAGFPFYYSFEQQGIFFVVWDASTANIPAEQLAWVERSLASDRAKAAKLRMMIGHLPLYGIAHGRDQAGEFLNRAEELRSVLERHQVHTYISGHDHAYYPGHKGNLELLHCGILGQGPRFLLNGDFPLTKTLTVVDVKLDAADTIYTTYDMVTMEVIQQQQLPRLIAAPTGKVLRRDLEWEDLTPEEQATEYTPTLN